MKMQSVEKVAVTRVLPIMTIKLGMSEAITVVVMENSSFGHICVFTLVTTPLLCRRYQSVVSMVIISFECGALTEMRHFGGWTFRKGYRIMNHAHACPSILQ